jgi:hypothetical protein
MVSVSTIFALIFLCLSIILFFGVALRDPDHPTYNLYIGGIIVCVVAADILASTTKSSWTSYDISGIVISFVGLIIFVTSYQLQLEEYGKILIGCSLLITVLGSSLLIQDEF